MEVGFSPFVLCRDVFGWISLGIAWLGSSGGYERPVLVGLVLESGRLVRSGLFLVFSVDGPNRRGCLMRVFLEEINLPSFYCYSVSFLRWER